jgi:hypothetical protein
MRAISRTMVLIILALLSMQLLAYPTARASTYEKSNAAIPNIQTTFPVRAGAFDPNENCVRNAVYNNHHSESWITIDPTDPSHLVGVSKFFSNPQYYLFHAGAMVSKDGGRSWKNTIIPGFDCRSAPRNGWSDTTDPVVAFDSNGAVYSAVLAFNLKYNPTGDAANCCPAAEVSVVRSTDGGIHWNLANQGLPLAFFPNSDVTPDKQWIAVDSNPHSPFRDRVYVGWTVIDNIGNAEIWFSVSSDRGQHFTTPVIISSDIPDGPNNTFVFLGTGPDGTLYSAYSSFPDPNSALTHVWVLSSRDGGATFTSPRLAASFMALATFVLPNTSFRDGVPDNFAVNPADGHLFVAMEVDGGKGLDVELTESLDGGGSWSRPVSVNDASTVNDGTDQFQPTVAASPDGIVAVTFYDRRLQCPLGDANILPGDRGRANFCINTSIQFYKDGPRGLEELGSNIRVSHATWDPQNPGSTTHQLPRPGGPKGTGTFIGDYFGLALADGKAYVLFASNYDQGRNPSNDQQQFLGIVSIPGDNGSGNHQTNDAVDHGNSLR